ncbi:hypothetical protein CY35_11G103600 [Sphagnum magellanicum]|nr:hypothetical protein CY35_11G103600 [Sphagnum magellanicum]
MFEGISEGEPVMLLTETIRHLQADADHGNAHSIQSKMALASTYSRQQMHEEPVKLYAELAATAMASFISSKDAPLMEPVQLNVGFEESRETLKKFRGER